jgi:two-component system nitrogen regulation response regulator NtrX
VIERLIIMVPGDTITAGDLGFLAADHPGTAAAAEWPADGLTLFEARDQFERAFIMRGLAAHQGNISRAAEALGVERSNLYRKMRAFGIVPLRRLEGEEETA